MLSDIVNNYQDRLSMNGMIYPSISNSKKSINILLKPIYAKNNYMIKNLQTFEINYVMDNKVSAKLVRKGVTIGEKTHPSEELNLDWTYITDGDSYDIEF